MNRVRGSTGRSDAVVVTNVVVVNHSRYGGVNGTALMALLTSDSL